MSKLTQGCTVVTGGPFAENATLLDGESLPMQIATYLYEAHIKCSWVSGNGVYPQFFLYNGLPLPDFSNDLRRSFGSGPLPQGNPDMDTYHNISTVIQIDEDDPTTSYPLFLYAFGYDEDHGSGSYIIKPQTSWYSIHLLPQTP